MKPLVSIILPIYNIDENYLTKCINSLMNQTYENIEIILVDDGSTNNSLEICLKMSESDSRIKVFHQENSGVSVARNVGLKNSKGKYICFVDPDDWVDITYVEELLSIITRTKSDIVLCDCYVHYKTYRIENKFLNTNGYYILKGKEKNKILYQLVGKKICDYYPEEIAAGVPWGKMFKKDFIDKYNLMFIPKMVRMQDNIFCLYAIQYANSITHLSKALYHYRKEQGSASYKFSPNIVEYFEKYYDETFKFLNKFNKEEKMYIALYLKELTSFNSYLNQNYFNKYNKKKFKTKKKELNLLINQDRYKKALNNINLSYLNFQEKVFIFFLKKKMYFMLWCLVKIRNLRKM